MTLFNAWRQKKLNISMVKDWVKKHPYTEEVGLKPDQINHVAVCIHRIYRNYHDKLPLGHFLSAVMDNDLDTAVAHADSTNIKALPLYVKYLWNYAPGDYRARWRESER